MRKPYCECIALYGSLFGGESEAAFSNYRMWESLGFIIQYAYSFYLCASVKIYILTSVLVVGMSGYLAVEYVHWKYPSNVQPDSKPRYYYK